MYSGKPFVLNVNVYFLRVQVVLFESRIKKPIIPSDVEIMNLPVVFTLERW
jgi:hypothetical protein